MNTHQTSNTSQQRDGCCCAGKSSTTSTIADANKVSESVQTLHRLQVQGATCGGCVKSIEHTLKSVAGVGEASMDLATGIASVVGVVEADHLVEALQRAGFPAAVIG